MIAAVIPRDRFQFLMTLGGALRSGPLYKVDLSNLCDFKFQQKDRMDSYRILTMSISIGKIHVDKVLHGSIMRHLNHE